MKALARWLDGLLQPDVLPEAPARFAEWLPWLAYDEASGLFQCEEGYGFVLECPPQVGADMEMARVLASVFMLGWPRDTCIQFTLYASPNVRPMLARWARARGGIPQGPGERRMGGVFREMARRRVAYLLRGTRRPLFEGRPYLVRDFRVFVSVVMPGRLDETRRREALEMKHALESSLAAAHLPTRTVDAGGLITLMAEILNQRELDAPLAHDPARLIRDQVLDYGTELEVEPDFVRIGGRVEARALSVKNYPEEFGLWAMGGLIGDLFQPNLQIPAPFLFTLGVYLPDVEASRQGAQMRAARATHDADSPMARLIPDFALKKRDWDVVLHALAEGHALVRLYHQLVVFCESGRGAAVEQAARAAFRAKNWELCPDKYVQVQGLLAALPLGLSKGLWADIERMARFSTKTTGNAAHMAPVLADWKGTGSPTLMLFSRRGQPMFLDLFDNREGNYNAAIAAASGSGKSFLLNEITCSHLGLGDRVWIIDVGRSYEKLCALLGGEFIVFSPESSICINPFTHVQDLDEEMALLKPLLARMASSEGRVGDVEASLLERATRARWEEEGPEMTVSGVAAELERMDDPRAKDLAVMLLPYTARGMYGRYFEGRNTLDFGNALVVLELEELKAKKDLQSVVLLLVMYQIQQAMYLGDRSQRKLCIIDEAWDLMSGAGEFIETGYRRVRKYGGAFITATQSVADYYANEAARAAFENSDWVLLLRQKKESIEQLERSGRLKMDEWMKRQIASLHTSHGEFSEVYVHYPGGGGIGRLIVDPFTALLYSSRAEDYAAIRRRMDAGMTVAEAVEDVLRERAA